ncbi:MAG: XisH family protein [Rhodothermales bacterium]
MPGKDIFHDAVRRALEKEDWTITHDPYFLRFGEVDLYIDLGAEQVIAAERAGQRIAVEIKSFVGASPVTDFHLAVGQFMNYRMALEEEEPERTLYLAVPSDVYDTFFELPFGQTTIRRHGLKLIVYHPEQEVIVTWQP